MCYRVFGGDWRLLLNAGVGTECVIECLEGLETFSEC